MKFKNIDWFTIMAIGWIILGLLMTIYVALIEHWGFPGYGP